MTPSSVSHVSHARPPAASATVSPAVDGSRGPNPSGERSASEAAARARDHGAPGHEGPLGTTAGKARLAYPEPPGGPSVFAHLLRQPWASEAEAGRRAGAGATGDSRGILHPKEGPGRIAPPRRDAPVDADGEGGGLQPLQAPVALSPSVSDGQAAAPAEARAYVTLEDLVPALVKKIAWSGDGHRGAMHLELGGGALSGATLLVRAEGGRVRVHLTAPAGTDLDDWRARIASRLAGRGLLVEEIEVD